MRRPPRVFTIPPGAPFLETFARRLLDGDIAPGYSRALGPLGIADAVIYVPTRRAGRALAQELTKALGTPTALLPRILPLGELEDGETESLFAGPEDDALSPDAPPAIGAVARRMLLARLILQWARGVRGAIIRVGDDGALETDPAEPLLVGASPANAWVLSRDLAALIDEMIIEDVAWSRLDALPLEDHDRYWGVTLRFLDIAMRAWPDLLAERGLIDAAARQKLLIEAQSARIAAGGDAPVIAIGSTGTNAATARLLAAIASAPRGAVVLPGLDQTLDAPSFALLAGDDPREARAGHPQAALARLLKTIGLARDEAQSLAEPPEPLALRARFVSEALRPAETAELWRAYAAAQPQGAIRRALEGVDLIEAGDEREEALALAVCLREALETPGRTAALITPDRDLARRVRSELLRWGVEIDDSGGAPLSGSPHGALARLAIRAGAEPSPRNVVALLASRLVRLGLPPGEAARLRGPAEIGALRGVLPPDALRDPAAHVAAAREAAAGPRAHPSRKAISESDWGAIADLLTRLVAALAPLTALAGEAPLPQWLAAHRAALGHLLADEDGASVFAGEDGARLAALLDELDAAADPALVFDARDYALFFDGLASLAILRGPRRAHPRLKILGLLEARLMPADLVLLGGLDEATWPPQTRTDAFLNRAMRHELGLSPPEKRIGRTAHDFAQALGAPRVVLSRARKRQRAPTVASRFLQRMTALAGADWEPCAARGRQWLHLARALDRPDNVPPIRQPAPKPPLALRPKRLSVTRVETLRRDPYAIHAEYILKLKPLDSLGAEIGVADFGNAFHAVLAEYVARHPSGPLPAQARAQLLDAARAAFAPFLRDPDFAALRWPGVEAAIEFWLGFETGRRAGLAESLVETSGALTFRLADGSDFTLTAQADRIDRLKTGAYAVLDYKTGTAPTKATVRVGFAPQLTLEAAMIERGAFRDIPDGARVAGALYVKLTGAGGGKLIDLSWKDASLADVSGEHFAQLGAYLSWFRDEANGYLSRPWPQYAQRYSDYDHLARVMEWSAGEGGEDA